MLTEVSPKLYLNPGPTGHVAIETARMAGMAIVHASKVWYEREAGQTLVGLKSLPQHNPEYYAAWRGKELYLNMVDTVDTKYFSHALIDPAVSFMAVHYMKGDAVFVHCDMGEHRSATIMLLFMGVLGILPPDFEAAEKMFRVMYPYFNSIHESNGEPTGIYQWVKAHWNDYV